MHSQDSEGVWFLGRDEGRLDKLYDLDTGPAETKGRVGWLLSQVEIGGVVIVEGRKIIVGARGVRVEAEKQGKRAILIPAQKETRVLEGDLSFDLKIFVNGEEVPIQESQAKPVMPKFKMPAVDIRGVIQRLKWKVAAPIDPELKKKTRKTMYVGLGFLLIGGLIFGVGGWKRADINLKQSADYQQVQTMWIEFGEAKATLTLDPKKGREMVNNLKSRLDNFSGKDVEDHVKIMKQELPGLLESAAGIVKKDLVEVVDLSLVRDAMEVKNLAKNGSKLVGLDVSLGRLLEVDLSKKSAKVLAGGFEQSLDVSVYVGRINVLGKTGIVEFPGTKKQIEASGVENVIKIWSFAGNIYGVTTDGEIWRYPAIEGGYAARSKWLAEAETRVAGPFDMAIDGSIWVLSENITKYTRGVKENFSIHGFDEKFGSGSTLYTDENVEKLYVLDPGQGRIVILTKTGEYESQIRNEALKNATDMVVFEKESKIYLAVGSKIVGINL